MKRPLDRKAPPPDPASVAREYLVLSRQARVEGIGASEERRRQELRGVLLELGRRQDPASPGQLERQFPRAPLAGLKLSLWYGSAAEFARAFAASLGTGGVMLHTKNPYPQGTELTIDFRRGSIGTIRAMVAWSTPDTMGLKFLDLRDDQQDEIEEMVCWALAERVLDTPTPQARRAQLRPGLGQSAAPKLPPAPFPAADESDRAGEEPLLQPAFEPLRPPGVAPFLAAGAREEVAVTAPRPDEPEPEEAEEEVTPLPPALAGSAGAPSQRGRAAGQGGRHDTPPPIPLPIPIPPPIPAAALAAPNAPAAVIPPPLPTPPARPPPLPATPGEQRRSPALRPGQRPVPKK